MIYTKYCKIFLFFFIFLIIFLLFSNKKEKFDEVEKNNILKSYIPKRIDNRNRNIINRIAKFYPSYFDIFEVDFLISQNYDILLKLFNEEYNKSDAAINLLNILLQNKNLTIIHILKLYSDIFTKYFLENYKDLNNLYNNIFRDIVNNIDFKINYKKRRLKYIDIMLEKDYFINAINTQKEFINKLNQTIKSWNDDKLIDEILKLYNSNPQKRNKFRDFNKKFNKNYLTNIDKNKKRIILEILYNDLIDNRTGDVDNIDFLRNL